MPSFQPLKEHDHVCVCWLGGPKAFLLVNFFNCSQPPFLLQEPNKAFKALFVLYHILDNLDSSKEFFRRVMRDCD
jgi:hypothetical protein